MPGRAKSHVNGTSPLFLLPLGSPSSRYRVPSETCPRSCWRSKVENTAIDRLSVTCN